MSEKSHRQDQALDARPARPHGGPTAALDDAQAHTKPSALWLAQGAAREEAVAREGTRGPAGELPYRGELEQALGVDLAGVAAYRGDAAKAAADKLGAEAYALRDQNAVVFGDAMPSKELVAHEVVHTLQRRGEGAVSEDEREADALGGKLAAGERVDVGAIASGGGKVRKKEKVNLSKIFDDYLQGFEESLEERYGPALPPGDKVEDAAAPDLIDLHEDGRISTEAYSDETKLAGVGLASTETEVTKRGIAETRAELRGAIDKGRTECAVRMIGCTFKAAQAKLAKQQLDNEIAAIDADTQLDPNLVFAQRALLCAKVAGVEQQLAELEKERAAYKQLDQHLADERAVLDSDKPADVAKRVEHAAANFVKATETTTTKRSTAIDLLAGTFKRTRELEHVEHDEAGDDTHAFKTEKTVKAGGGKLSSATTESRSKKRTADGVTTGTEREVETTNDVLVNKDGSYGLGRGKKLSGAIENSYGKATGGAGLGGAITANIIEIPQAMGETRYAVVVTIDVALALEAGLEKAHENEEKKTKARAAFKASGSAAAQLTQTRVMSETEVKRYLGELDKVANGGTPKSDKPEFGVLHKALAGAASLDDMLLGAASVASSSEAAKQMKLDESIELTTKVGGEVSGSLGGSAGAGGAKSVGVEGSAKGELFRTLKVGRVTSTKGDKELVEVTCSFGTSSEIHGAATASMLGVSATVGRRAWDSETETVTFRLDDTQPDYGYLYDEIVQTLTPGDLKVLRTSRRFAQHVQAYASKTTTGDEDQLGIGGALGVDDKRSVERTSERGMTEGRFTGAEEGRSTRSTGFSIGALEALRRTQTDGARFDIADGVSMLDVSEATDASWIGRFDPDAKDYLTEQTPAKAAQKALHETYKKLDGFFLDPEDVEVIVQKARTNPTAWNNVAFHADNNDDTGRAEAWRALRVELARREIPNEPGVPIEVARELHHGTLIASFMASDKDAKGADYMRVLLRGYAAAGGGDGRPGGTMYEFPADVSAQKYRELRRAMKALPLTLATWVADGEAGLEPGQAYIAGLQFDVATMLKSIEQSYGFESERARMEMIAELRELAASVPKAQRDFQRQCTGVEPDARQEMYDGIADAKAKVSALETTLEKSKISEQWLLDRLERRTEEYAGQALREEMAPLITNLRELWKQHVLLVKDVRAACAAGCTESKRVSMSSRDARKELDIAFSRFPALYAAFQKADRFNVGLLQPRTLGGDGLRAEDVLANMQEDFSYY